jgi:hypothetical protein
MFGHAAPEAVHLPYLRFVKPGVRLPRELRLGSARGLSSLDRELELSAIRHRTHL